MNIPQKHKEQIIDWLFYPIGSSYKSILEDGLGDVSEAVFNEEYSIDDIDDFVKKCKEIILESIKSPYNG